MSVIPPRSKAYGEGREQTQVSYGDIERTAIAILKSERRPTVDTVREALGRGSNGTIGEGLRRFWRDLGVRIEGDPAALSRMPAEIAEFADGVWQRALTLAGEAAKNDDNAARERLRQIQIENELKAQSFALREAEWDTQARERERALADSRDHLLLTLKALNREQVASQARDDRIADLEATLEQYRRQLASLIGAAVVKSRAVAVSKKRRSIPIPRAGKAPRKRGKAPPRRSARSSRLTPNRAAKSVGRPKGVRKSSSRRSRG
jgi:Plasmid replication region DNA-binding N-term